MIGYKSIEKAVTDKLLYQLDLDPSLCSLGDVDALFDAMQRLAAPLGFLVEYGGGRRMKDGPFAGKAWTWQIDASALLRYEGDSRKIEDDARVMIDKIATMFDGSPTLGGLVAIAAVIDIEPPTPATVNDVPFYWVSFGIAVMEKI